jgi:4-hydroxy-tetrahydrodipicolinate synthase
MNRTTLLHQLIDPAIFPFWVPVISHYCKDDAGIAIDAGRMLKHARQIYPHTRCWMLGGTTGDGWALTDAQFDQLLDYALTIEPNVGRPALILGALQPGTEAVLARIARIRQRLGLGEQASLAENLPALAKIGLVGVTICAPVGEQLSQDQIYTHIARICAESRLPVIIYQLPQVTHNLIAPETFHALVAEYDNILFFKDSGGGDEIARAGLPDAGVVMVRGAEGGYLEALRSQGGGYDGWLLSTGNAFAHPLALIVAQLRTGRIADAQATSARLSEIVAAVFDIARQAPSGNPFSNANRAVDHLRAYGRAWGTRQLPLLQDGSRLPAGLIAQIEAILRPTSLVRLRDDGYIQ